MGIAGSPRNLWLCVLGLASAIYVLADSPGWLWAARLGQGAAASAFSPAASALVARLNEAGNGRIAWRDDTTPSQADSA